MAQVTITWTPAGGGNSVSQTVQYRLEGSSTWIDTSDSPLSSSANTCTITGLTDNELYEFRVVNNCSAGGPTPSNLTENAKPTCPTVGTTHDYASISYSFTPLGGDITSYVVQLLNAAGDTVLTSQTKTSPFGSSVTGTFTGLSASTSYKIRVIVNIAGSAGTYSKSDCAFVSITTDATPTCLAPTGVTATWS